MAAIHRPLAVFTFTGVNRSRGKIAREEGDMFLRAQGDSQRLLHPAIAAAQHRVRELFAGAYRRRNLSIEIFTRTRPERRQKIVAREMIDTKAACICQMQQSMSGKSSKVPMVARSKFRLESRSAFC